MKIKKKKIYSFLFAMFFLSFVVSNNLYGRVVRSFEYLFPENVVEYIQSVSKNEVDFANKLETLNWWINKYKSGNTSLNETSKFVLKAFAEFATYELSKKSFMMEKRDFQQKFDIFDGKTLNGLLKLYRKKGGFWVLRRELNILPSNLEEWIIFFKNFGTDWKYVPLNIQAAFLKKAAGELEISLRALNRHHLEEKFVFLGNKSLSGLYNYYWKNLKKAPDDVKSRFPMLTDYDLKKDMIYVMFKATGLLPKTGEEWIEYIAVRQIEWIGIPLEIRKLVVDKAAEELETEAYKLTSHDFDKKGFEFLGNKSLVGLINCYDSIYDLKQKLGILNSVDDWVKFISNCRVRWKFVPEDIQKQLIVKASQELEIKVYQLGREHFMKYHYDFLKGKLLASLLINHHNDMFELRKKFALFPKTTEEWIHKISTAKSMKGWWKYIPNDIRYELVQRLALSFNITPKELMKSHFKEPCDFLNGKKLRPFIEVCYKNIEEFRENIIYPIEQKWIGFINISAPKWVRIPIFVQRMYIMILAKYLGKSVTELKSDDFYVTVPRFGRSLIGLYSYYGDVYSLKRALGLNNG